MVTAAARARAHVPPARINYGISTLLGHTARYARIMGAYTYVSPDSRYLTPWMQNGSHADHVMAIYVPSLSRSACLYKRPLMPRSRVAATVPRRYGVTYRMNCDNRPRRDRGYARRREFTTVLLYAVADSSRSMWGERRNYDAKVADILNIRNPMLRQSRHENSCHWQCMVRGNVWLNGFNRIPCKFWVTRRITDKQATINLSVTYSAAAGSGALPYMEHRLQQTDVCM